MKMLLRIILTAGLLQLSPGGLPRAQQPQKEISPAAKAYLQEALDTMEKNSIRKRSIDWNALQQRALKLAAAAEVPADTYDAIRFALRELKDSHSSLELSKELRDREALRKPKADQNRFLIPDRPLPTPGVVRGPEGYIHKIGGQAVARLVTPAYDESPDDSVAAIRATQLQKTVEELDGSNPCGWIIDLRGNTTSDLWSTLAGLGPVLGEGGVAGFRDADGNLIRWFYREGKAGIRNLLGVEQNLAGVTARPYHLKRTALVAVLIDRRTVNSAEAIALTFKGRPGTRFFGEGISITSVEKFPLSDGANLLLTVGVYVDRAGNQYPEGLLPDEAIAIVNRNPREGEDPLIHAALGWIGEQAECSAR